MKRLALSIALASSSVLMLPSTPQAMVAAVAAQAATDPAVQVLQMAEYFRRNDVQALVSAGLPPDKYQLLLSEYEEQRQRPISEAERAEFQETIGLKEPGLNRIIKAGYKLLGLQTYFTAGEKEVRAWTIKAGFTAPQAAGVIHTDFEKGFIRAETIAYADYVEFKGEAGAKQVGKLRLEGKDYIVKEGDVLHFRFNV